MNKKKILIVDDEQEISNLIKLYLIKENFQVLIAESGQACIDMVRTDKPDLIILDILLPDMDGITVCQRLRRESNTPILFLSCKDDDSDKVLGLGIGGDDYITKPFSPNELIARVKSHLRRSDIFNSPTVKSRNLLRYPGFEIDLSSYTVYINDNPIYLPAKEFQLLALLAQNPNQLFNTDQLYDLIWQEDVIGDTRTVVVHISNLRKKIEADPMAPKYIQNLRGIGYKFNTNLL